MSNEFSQSINSNGTHENLSLELEGYPQLLRHEVRYKRNMQFRWAGKNKPSDKELFIRKNTESPAQKI